MTKSLHILFLLLMAYGLSAQAPGYLGKRFYATAYGQVSVSEGPTPNNHGRAFYFGEDANSKYLALDAQYGLKGGFAYSRMKAVNFGIGYLKTAMTADAYTPVLNVVNQSAYDHHSLFYHLRGIPVTIGHQWFRAKKGAIAPFGTYWATSLNSVFFKGEIIDKQTNGSDNGQPIQHAKLGTNPKATYLSLGLEFGRNSLIKDNLLVNYACFFNVPLQWGQLDQGDFDSSSDNYLQYNQENFEENVILRMSFHGYFGFHLGLGLFVK